MSPPSTGLQAYLSSHPAFQDAQSSSSALPSLYSDLSRQRKTNPAGYHANIEWWRDILTDVTWRGVQYDQSLPAQNDEQRNARNMAGASANSSRTVFCLDEGTKIRWTVSSVGRPLGLGTVLSELEKSGHATTLSRFLQSTTPVSGPQTPQGRGGLRTYVPSVGTVASTLLLSPAKWAVSQLGLPSIAGNASNDDSDYSEDEMLFKRKKGNYVIYQNVARLSSAFLEQHWATSSLNPLTSLLTMTEFTDKLNTVSMSQFGFVPSEQDVQVVLKHLTRDCGGIARSERSMVKLASSELDPVANPITEEDRGVLAVKTTHRQLESQIQDLESKIAERNTRIKAYLATGSKSQALSYLRSRKALQELLSRRMDTLETLTGVLLKIEQAKGDVELVRSYQTSSNVLNSILANPELKMDNVDVTVARLEDSLSAHQQVDDALRDIGQSASQIDEDEIQDELEALLQEQRQQDTKVTQDTQQATSQQKQEEQQNRSDDQELARRLEQLRMPRDQPDEAQKSKHSASPIAEP